MTPSQLKIAIEEEIKIHEWAVANLPWLEHKSQVKAGIRAYEKVIEMIDGPTLPEIDDSTPDCDCAQHRYWHPCPFHGYHNPVTGVGV